MASQIAGDLNSAQEVKLKQTTVQQQVFEQQVCACVSCYGAVTTLLGVPCTVLFTVASRGGQSAKTHRALPACAGEDSSRDRCRGAAPKVATRAPYARGLAAGITDVNQLQAKFLTRDSALESLREQQAIYEVRCAVTLGGAESEH